MPTATAPIDIGYELTSDALPTLTISTISSVVRRNWKNVNFAAKPYLEAMQSLTTIDDNYYCDSGREIVLYFLNNAGTWRGDVAKLVKAELNRRLKK